MGQGLSTRGTSPVSISDLRLDTTMGQAPDTAAMNLEFERSIE